MCQNSSTLLCLPRELRDLIYVVYVSEEHGYHYDASSREIYDIQGQSIDVALRYICRTTAHEVGGLGLQINTLHFLTTESIPETIDKFPSAVLFDKLLDEQHYALEHMLSWSRRLVTLPVLMQLVQQYPEDTSLKDLAGRNKSERDTWMRTGWLSRSNASYSLTYHTQLQDLVVMLASNPEFKALTSKEYRPHLWGAPIVDYMEPMEDINGSLAEWIAEIYPRAYSEGTRDAIISWRPDLWWALSGTNLDCVIPFLEVRDPVSGFDHTGREWRKRKYFFAAAKALQCIRTLTSHNRRSLRRILLHEDHPSVTMPESHGQGFITICQENTKLVVERRVDIWQTSVLGRSDLRRAPVFVLQDIMAWIHEAKDLRGKGMTVNSFKLVLHGPSAHASQQLLDIVVQSAMLQQAALEDARRQDKNHPFQWQNPAHDFPEVIKEILHGDIPVRFDAKMIEDWDLEEMLWKRDGDWPKTFNDVFTIRDLEEPSEG